MTYLHFLNCISLTFGPLVMTYRSTSISELNGYPTLVSIFFYYLIFEGLKLFILACLPSSLLNIFNDDTINDGFSIFVEISRILLDSFFTMFGMIYCYKNGRFINKMQPSTIKILCVGLGWSFSNTITHYLIPLWPARQIQFNWKFIFMAIKSNLFFLLSLSLSSILYQPIINNNNDKKKQDKNKQNSSSILSIISLLKTLNIQIYIIFLISSSIPTISQFLIKVLMIPPSTCMLIEILLTLIIVFFVYVTVRNKTFKSD